MSRPPSQPGPIAGLTRAWQRLWFEAAFSATALARFRVVFFALVGLDAFLQLSHAARYGAGDFNVPHLRWLDALPTPSRDGMVLVFLLEAYLALRIAAGAASRRALALLAVLYGYGYFISQLDSYQHHYLLFLLVALLGFVPWRDTGSRAPDARVRSWAARLVLVQLSLVYAWAVVAKLEPAWLDGSALRAQLSARWAVALVGDHWSAASWLVIATELVLAVLLHVRRLRGVAFVVGVSLHVAIEALGFEIGMFSWFMLALYLLVADSRLPRWAAAATLAGAALVSLLPEQGSLWRLSDPHTRLLWFAAVICALALPDAALGWPRAALSRARDRLAALSLPRPRLALALALPAGAAPLLALPFEAAPVTATAVALVGLALAVRAPRQLGRHAAGHLAACAALLAMHAGTDQALDYYRYLGGDARRRGELDTAVAAYERVRELDPDYAGGRLRLGDLYAREGRADDALAEYWRAASLDPDDHRALLGQARVFRARGDVSAATRAAARALDAIARRRARGALTPGIAQQLARDERAARTLAGP